MGGAPWCPQHQAPRSAQWLFSVFGLVPHTKVSPRVRGALLVRAYKRYCIMRRQATWEALDGEDVASENPRGPCPARTPTMVDFPIHGIFCVTGLPSHLRRGPGEHTGGIHRHCSARRSPGIKKAMPARGPKKKKS